MTVTARKMKRDLTVEEQLARGPMDLPFLMLTLMLTGIGLVMGRFRLMQENDGKVVLQNLPAPIRKVMKLAGLDKLAEFH